jgi:hypothetical protein
MQFPYGVIQPHLEKKENPTVGVPNDFPRIFEQKLQQKEIFPDGALNLT